MRSYAIVLSLGVLLLNSCSLFAGRGGIGTPPSASDLGTPEGSSQTRTPEGSSQTRTPTRTPEGSSQTRTPEGSSHRPRDRATRTPEERRTPEGSSHRPRDRAKDLSLAIEQKLVPKVQFRGEERFDTLKARMKALNVPGVSIAVFEKFELVWAKAYGLASRNPASPVTPLTRFQAASISKPVNALTLVRIANQLGISLDAPINEHLKSWKIPKHAWSASNPVTIRQLLSHTAGTTVHGFPGYARGERLPNTKQILDAAQPTSTAAVVVDQAPGTRVRYSGGGVMVTRLLAEDLLGKSYPSIASTFTLDPLQMGSSGYTPPLNPASATQAAAAHDAQGQVISGRRRVYPELAAAGLWTTPTDLAKFMIAIVKARNGIISPVSAQEAQTLAAPVRTIPGTNRSTTAGFFLDRYDGRPMFGHGGSNRGFRCDAAASLSDGYGYFIMTNGEQGSQLIDHIRRTLLSQNGWPGGYETLTRKPLPGALVESLVGTYQADGLLTFEIEAQGSTIHVRRPFRQPSPLVFVGRGRFVDPVSRSFYSIDSRGGPIVLEDDSGASQNARRMSNPGKAPLFLLATSSVKAAVSGWHGFALGLPESELNDYEKQLNALGYSLASDGNLDDARKVLHFVSLVRPKSFNALDSLAEIEGMRDRTAPSIFHYEGALRLLAKDKSLTSSVKRNNRARIERQITEFRGRSK